MTIRFKCTRCGTELNVADGLAGKQGKCPKCKSILTVPAPKAAPARGSPPKNPNSGILRKTRAGVTAMPIRFKGTRCGPNLNVADGRAGKQGKSPKCKSILTAPAPKAAPVARKKVEEEVAAAEV